MKTDSIVMWAIAIALFAVVIASIVGTDGIVGLWEQLVYDR